MSRRHTSRALDYDPDQPITHLDESIIPMWFAVRMPYPWDHFYWHQWLSAWADLTLDVCNRAWRRHGARYYAAHRDRELRDDLYDWLIVKAMEIAANYTPNPSYREPDQAWAAYLWSNLATVAPHHFSEAIGRANTSTGLAARAAHSEGIASTDHLNEMEAEGIRVVGRHALHGEPFENSDPPHVLMRLEELQAHVEHIEREDLRAGTYSTSSTSVGQTCLTALCDRPSIARGLCRSHYQAERNKAMPNCNQNGCATRAVARGLCSTHYEEAKTKGVKEGTWKPYDTPDKCAAKDCETTKIEARGMCRQHYEVWRQTNLKRSPCSVDGCTTIARTAGLCRKHHTAWTKAKATGEGDVWRPAS